ncbi:hypothetical protein FALBO_3611 [Fusarium albosuccineum]|uniref:Zn(2)-C6 fungal-type domain-containing protein n=1 Tax=Fusarium albosuccineum TaxID=1237068 RepID=A0A8H4PFU3_9HYPO|nr:hypothetical protein FALBO_3611 [Fusarium albosuccineum]
MPKQRRKPACDPCRKSKLACDHAQPVCSRCQARSRPGQCTYRQKPFKKTRPPEHSVPDGETIPAFEAASQSRDRRPSPGASTLADTPSGASATGLLPKRHPYPNPGYLGSSSHTALFGHIPRGLGTDGDSLDPELHPSIAPSGFITEAHISHGAELIQQLRRYAHITECLGLVRAWLRTGTNLVLASLFTQTCLDTADFLFAERDGVVKDARSISSGLFMHSCQAFTVTPDTTFDQFKAQFSNQNARWETICLFLITVSRATMSFRYSDPPFDSETQRRHIRRLAMHYSDRCLDICLSLDCLNDLQLVLQYENFILHTLVDGDQSFESWRKLGDMSSSLFALGYHQDFERTGPIPEFLKRIRQAAFAYSYSADKNVAIFLGRPPRISSKFCHFRQRGLDAYYSYHWAPDTPLDLLVDARWTALCAVLKEQILLELFGDQPYESRVDKASQIRANAETQWSMLPQHFRLEAPIKTHDHQPAELDIMLGMKLSHLHVLFLLRLALVRRVSEPDTQLYQIAEEMLGLVVEAVILKDRLVHSSTSLVWKVVYFGLSAAGVMCLTLLQHPQTPEHQVVISPKGLRDLGVLVVEVEVGTLVYKEDANYALLAGATKTIKAILDKLYNTKLHQQRSDRAPLDMTAQPMVEGGDGLWDPWGPSNFQDFEFNFWHTLSEHPFLLDEAGNQFHRL